MGKKAKLKKSFDEREKKSIYWRNFMNNFFFFLFDIFKKLRQGARKYHILTPFAIFSVLI